MRGRTWRWAGVCAMLVVGAPSAHAQQFLINWSYTIEAGPTFSRAMVLGDGALPSSGGWLVGYAAGVTARYHVIDGLALEMGGVYAREGFRREAAPTALSTRVDYVRIPLALRLRLVHLPVSDLDIFTGPEFGIRVRAQQSGSDLDGPRDITAQTSGFVWGWQFGLAYDQPMTEHTWLGTRLRAGYDVTPLGVDGSGFAPPSGRVHTLSLQWTLAFRYGS